MSNSQPQQIDNNSVLDKEDGDLQVNKTTRRKWEVPNKLDNISKFLITQSGRSDQDESLPNKKSLFSISKEPQTRFSKNCNISSKSDENDEKGNLISSCNEPLHAYQRGESGEDEECNQIFPSQKIGVGDDRFNVKPSILEPRKLNISKDFLLPASRNPRKSNDLPISEEHFSPDDENNIDQNFITVSSYKSPLFVSYSPSKSSSHFLDKPILRQDVRQRTQFESPSFQDNSRPLKKCIRVHIDEDEEEIDTNVPINKRHHDEEFQRTVSASEDQFSNTDFSRGNPLEIDIIKPCRYIGVEDGLADDDSWVEEMSHDGDDKGSVGIDGNESESSTDRQSLDFTLHTIIEESCEESESETDYKKRKHTQGATTISDLERYFFFGSSGEKHKNDHENSELQETENYSESSSEISEIIRSFDHDESEVDPYYTKPQEETEEQSPINHSENIFSSDTPTVVQEWKDSDGSVGSDSESIHSPEAQRRKKSVKARGMGRSHSTSLDNILNYNCNSQNQASQENSLPESQLRQQDNPDTQYEETSSETEINVEGNQNYGPNTESPFDLFKRKKKKLKVSGSQSSSSRSKEENVRNNSNSDEILSKDEETNNNKNTSLKENEFNLTNIKGEYTSLKESSELAAYLTQSIKGSPEPKRKLFLQRTDYYEQSNKITAKNSAEESNLDENIESSKEAKERLIGAPFKPAIRKSSLIRKDSFNNWSSDEETNQMMSKMRQFFKSMVDNNLNQMHSSTSTIDEMLPTINSKFEHIDKTKSRILENRKKSPQLVYFENELTRLMKTVPGIRDDQVREIVEYLSSEDTWSDSYDSSDYTNSDFEGAHVYTDREMIQKEVSKECKKIVDKLDSSDSANEVSAGQKPYIARDAFFVYQKLIQSFTKFTNSNMTCPQNSPTLVAKVMHHIGSRLVALMHEVSENNTFATQTSQKKWSQHYKPASSMLMQDDHPIIDPNNKPQQIQMNKIPRSKSHDPLLLLNNQTSSGINSFVSETEDRDVSDCERFSWRGSFESALMAADSRTKLSLQSSSYGAVAEVASTGNLLSTDKILSREQIDRVKSCGSIGVSENYTPLTNDFVEDKYWSKKRRSSVPNNIIQDLPENLKQHEGIDLVTGKKILRAMTLPRHVLTSSFSKRSGSNSLPRFHNIPIQQKHIKSARYRPPGFSRSIVPTNFENTSKISTNSFGLQLPESENFVENVNNSKPVERASFVNLRKIDDPDGIDIFAPSRFSKDIMRYNQPSSQRTEHLSYVNSLRRSCPIYPVQAQEISLKFNESEMEESNNFENISIKGEIELSLQYNYKDSALEIHVMQCRGLAPVDVKRGRSDPYVKIYLLPDKSKSGKRKTKVIKQTLNPYFNEILKFNISLEDLKNRTMWISVWHSDVFCRNNFLGQLIMPLENKIFDNPKAEWYPLSGKIESLDRMPIYQGEIIVGLKYSPENFDVENKDPKNFNTKYGTQRLKHKSKGGTLYVLVKEARNLQTNCKTPGTYNAFCKSYLLPDRGRLSKQKTNVVKRSNGSPVWNHTFVYKDVSIEKLVQRCLELTVWSYDRIASNVFLGGIRLNLGTGKFCGKPVDWMDATDREVSLWQGMLERPNYWMEGCVSLRSNIHEE